MDKLGLPLRMFEAGSEPSGRKRVNNYFNLRWIDIIKSALEEEDLEMLNESQFRRVLQMGSHTFSVMFLHYCLSRQLLTAKEYELWWIFVGKPIRYAIQDFALVTRLNCGDGVGLTGEAAEKGIGRGKASGKGKSSMSIWDDLFRGEEKPTPGWIMERLVKGKKYKDRLTRLRLSLLVLVEGILCPTCGTTKIRPEIVSMLGDLDAFMKYPWGRESFILTVRSTKARSAVNYVKDTMAIQGFTHAMVLVTVTACPSIIIKTGGADPLADSTLSSEEIISRVVDRKVVVNIVSAKTVDQLGQAYVRSLISTDEEGEDLYRGLGDKEDTSVDTMVALIDDDYPFEHNTWSGGVKADEPVEKDNAHHGGVESGGYPGDPRGKSSANPSGAPHGGESFHFDVQTLLRRAADAYEEKVIAMYEGYILSLKGHFNSEVTGEFDKINQLLKSRLRGADMGPTYGFSPERHSSPFPGQNDDFNNSEVNPDRPTTHTGAPDGMGTHTKFVSTQRDGEDVAGTGTASVGLGQNLDEGERGGGLSPGKQTDSTDGVEFRAETGGEHRGDAHIGHDPINMEDQVNVSSECRIDDPLSGVVNKILSEAGVDKNPLRPSTGSGTDVPQTSADVIPEKVGLDGVHDDRGEAAVGKKGEDVDEDDVTITKVQVGRGNTDAAGGQADGGRRFSRRTHTSTKRYTPPAPTVRKKEGNKKVPRQMDDNVPPFKRVKKVSVEPSGFSPFTPPTPAEREAFLKIMAEEKSNAPSLGSVISIASFDDVFNCTGVCSYKAVDRVIGWIRKRRDINPSSKFDFIPPTFFMDLIRSYPAFEAMQDKAAFTFPMSLRSQFMHRPQWFTQVDFLYTLILVKDRHWVGMIVDLAMWAIYVVDANQTCPPISVVKDVVNPIPIMMPHMISRFCLTSRPRELNYLPFPISRIDIPVLLEHPGYAAVVGLILLEIAAVGNPLIDLSLTEEEVRVAAENYAISTLGMFKVVPTNPAV
ncbi:BnaC02g20420D [Brassica napus]|uniref:BnaC02g20420D protein n=1 Tax=Brassica napus TaxID=3708 RepID=A0A078F4W1_BRANA|nr:BnaC02g20420D [Brassica napus]